MKVPVLQLGDILLTSIQVDLTDDDAATFQTDLSEAIHRTEAQGVVIDISALDVVDTFLARVLNESARISALLGAHVAICGMKPAVALTLIEMGRDLLHVHTALNLEQGLAHLRATLEREA